MTNGKARKEAIAAKQRVHIEEMLDEALQETFPASDPVSIEIEPLDTLASRHRSYSDVVLQEPSE